MLAHAIAAAVIPPWGVKVANMECFYDIFRYHNIFDRLNVVVVAPKLL